jgi:hypothetical protein
MAPLLTDEIPWGSVFDWVATLGHDLVINPEIHHKNKVGEAINFCNMMIEKKRAVP